MNETRLGRPMIPQSLRDAWAEGEAQIEAGDFDAVLDTLRNVWAEHSDAADHANTWKLVGDAKAGQAREMDPVNRKLLRAAHAEYQKALKKDHKHRAARRADSALLAELDGMGVRATNFPALFDDGAPTVYGLLAIVTSLMLLLTTLKYLPEIKDVLGLGEPWDEPYTATLTFELFADDAPNTVESFKIHASAGNYDDVIFHRIIDGFMIQGGDIESGNGQGGYAAKWYGQGDQSDSTTYVVPDEFHPDRRHNPGALAMANSGVNTAGSQFYIVDKEASDSASGESGTHWLNGYDQYGQEKSCGSQGVSCHTVFGQVIAGTYEGKDLGGLDMVDILSEVEANDQDQPLHPPYIHSIEIDGNTAIIRLVIP